MKRITSIHAYDVLSQIAITALVREYPDYDEGPSEVVLQEVAYLDSEGEEDAREWLKSVLIGLLEHL